MKYFYPILILFLFSPFTLLAQEKIDAEFEMKDGKIYINYSIKGISSTKYKVAVLLRRESEPTFKYEPTKLSGDIGEGFFAAGMKTIIWELSSNEKMSFASGDDFWFEVSAEEVKSGWPWYYYAGGAIVAGVGAVVAILLGGNKAEDPAVTTLPLPPARP